MFACSDSFHRGGAGVLKAANAASGSSILGWASDGLRQGINLSCNYSLWKRGTLMKRREELTAATLVPNQVNLSNSI